MKHLLNHLWIFSLWTRFQKPSVESDCFGVAAAVAGPCQRFARSFAMRSGVFKATFALQAVGNESRHRLQIFSLSCCGNVPLSRMSAGLVLQRERVALEFYLLIK